LLSLCGSSYFAVDATLATVAGTPTVALPATFYQLVSVHIRWSTDRNEEVRELPAEGDRFLLTDAGQWAEDSPKAFRIIGSNIEFYPTPTSAQTVVLRHVPTATQLVALSDPTPSINGWHKLCALQIAKELRMIRGQANGMLEGAYQQELERITTIAAERAMNEPARIRDVSPEVSRFSRWGGPWSI
jgi:hypothetical protein